MPRRGIEIDQAGDRNARRIQAKDVRRGKRCCRFDPRSEAVLSRELSQHDRGRLVDQGASGHAQDGVFTLPIRRESIPAEVRQVFVGGILRNAFHRGRCFGIGG